MNILRGRTSQIMPVRAVDTNGIPKTGLLFNTSGLSCVYMRELDTAPTTVTLATMTAGTWASGGFIEVNSGSLPGVYQLGIPNAAISAADASTWVVIQLVGTNVYFQPLRIDLVAYNPQDSVRQGMTALPNANAESAGGLYTRGSGAGQINQPANGQIDANVVKIGGTVQTARDIGASVLLSPGTGTGQVDLSSGQVKVQSGTSAGQLDVTSGVIQSDIAKWRGTQPNTLQSGRVDSYIGAAVAGILVTAADIWSYLKSNAAALPANTIGKWFSDLLDWLTQTRIENLDDLDAPVSGISSPTVAQIADGVWDEPSADHNTAGTMGHELNDAGSAADPLANEPSDYSAGQIGYLIGSINAKTSRIGTGSVQFVGNNWPQNSPHMPIVPGNVYKRTYGNAWDMIVTGWAIQDGDTIVYTSKDANGDEWTATGIAETIGTDLHVFIEMTATESANAADSTYKVDWIPVVGDTVTILEGSTERIKLL